jgi:hypothetical protein
VRCGKKGAFEGACAEPVASREACGACDGFECRHVGIDGGAGRALRWEPRAWALGLHWRWHVMA